MAEQQQQFLLALLQAPSASLAHLVASPAVSSVLAHSLQRSRVAHNPHPHRPLLYAVVCRLAQIKNALPLPLLALYAHAFLPSNQNLVRRVAHDALAATPKLAQQLAPTLVHALELALALGDLQDAHVILALVRATADSPVWTREPLTRLVHLIDSHYPPHGGDHHLRLALVETAHDLVLAAAQLGVDSLHPVLTSWLLHHDDDSAPSKLAQDLATLYNSTPRLADQLSQHVLGAVGPVARSTKDLIARFAKLATASSSDWLQTLQQAAEQARSSGGETAENEQGGYAAAASTPTNHTLQQPEPQPEQEAELTKAVTQILDLFPSESPAFLRACLVHPQFNPAASTRDAASERAQERVVEALLSASAAAFPDELVALRFGSTADRSPPADKEEHLAQKQHGEETATAERRNVYDDDKYFRRGTLLAPKPRATGSAERRRRPGRDLELDERLKQSILALAERESSDDDDDDDDDLDGDDGAEVDGQGRHRRTYGFLEEEEEEEEGTATPRIRSHTPQRARTPAPAVSSSFSAGYDPSAVLLLEATYLRDPGVFARDGATRRGRARKDLKERTGLGDEQIEGWKVMLERDPKQLQRMQDKHVDLGARSNRRPPPAAADSAASARGSRNNGPPPSRRTQGGGPAAHGGGGAKNAGGSKSGGGGSGSQGSGQGQAPPKRSDGGRREHDRAKRGRDRKLARMGAAGAPVPS
ncbi:hypothetical protein JCM3774_002835 [Rhodotorula dairenensis]